METTLCTIADMPSRPFEEQPLLQPLILPKDSDFVRIRDYLPNVSVDLKYAGKDNFTGQTIYGFSDAYLRYGTVLKLKAVCAALEEKGLTLKIWDSFRPVSAQFSLWEVCPDSTYVADPNVGFSNHSRGNAVDVTLVDAAGEELLMPSGFDDFSTLASRDYTDCPAEAAENARLLESVMEKYGFSGYWGEWWHFSDTVEYDVETCFDPLMISERFLSTASPLLENPDDPSSRILNIPKGERVTLLGYQGHYAMVEYWGYRGYVRAEFLEVP